MSSLKTLDKEPFEILFGMASGYVLDFTNAKFAEFFRESVGVDIYCQKYQSNGDSKAKRLRAFWEIESDPLVGKALAELIDYWCYKNVQPDASAQVHLQRAHAVIGRLLGKPVSQTRKDSEDQFLERDFSSVSISKVQIDQALVPILEARFTEATRCMQADSPLATIFLCGSILEGLLLGLACANPQQFNQAPNSPKDLSGKVRQFQEWSLAQFIDVACELDYLKLDVKKFSHVLRDFRNYVHPYQQMASRFSPDRHTAQICLQVLKAAIASVTRDRGT